MLLVLALLAHAPILIRADEAGLIDVPAALVARETALDQEPVPNPFRRHLHPLPPARQIAVVVGGILLPGGPERTATCFVNGLELLVGDAFEGLTVARIDPDGVTVTADRFSVYLPLGSAGLVLRLPR